MNGHNNSVRTYSFYENIQCQLFTVLKHVSLIQQCTRQFKFVTRETVFLDYTVKLFKLKAPTFTRICFSEIFVVKLQHLSTVCTIHKINLRFLKYCLLTHILNHGFDSRYVFRNAVSKT